MYLDNFFELSEGARMAEATTPKRRSRGQNTTASVGEGLGVHIALEPAIHDALGL